MPGWLSGLYILGLLVLGGISAVALVLTHDPLWAISAAISTHAFLQTDT